MIKIIEVQSSLISHLLYDSDELNLTVFLRNHKKNSEITYIDVDKKTMLAMMQSESIGKFYLNKIKPKFKKMSEESKKPKTINKSSDKARTINISIDVNKIIKEWLVAGKKSTYMNISLKLMPDGEVDNYGNLGYVSQVPPKEIKDKEKGLPKEQKTRWPILGNGTEFEYIQGEGGESVADLQNAPPASPDAFDDLPF